MTGSSLRLAPVKTTFPTRVLVSSDKRPYSDLTFHNVSARQGTSYCNRALLNLQAFALRDMKIGTEKAVAYRSKDKLSLKFLLTEQCLH